VLVDVVVVVVVAVAVAFFHAQRTCPIPNCRHHHRHYLYSHYCLCNWLHSPNDTFVTRFVVVLMDFKMPSSLSGNIITSVLPVNGRAELYDVVLLLAVWLTFGFNSEFLSFGTSNTVTKTSFIVVVVVVVVVFQSNFGLLFSMLPCIMSTYPFPGTYRRSDTDTTNNEKDGSGAALFGCVDNVLGSGFCLV
jgi:hypothetical protein